MSALERVARVGQRLRGVVRSTFDDALYAAQQLRSGVITTNPDLPVNEITATCLSALWRGVHLVADQLAGCDLQEWRGTTQVAASRVLQQPNPALVRRDFMWATLYCLALHHRNYWIVSARDRDGWPSALFVAHPHNVRPPAPEESDRRWYVGRLRLPVDDVIEMRRSPLPGPHTGLTLLSAGRNSIAAAIAADNYAARYWSDNGVPEAVITHPGNLAKGQAEELLEQWMMGGYARRPRVISGGVTAQNLAPNPRNAQALESRQHNVQEIARWLNLPSWALDGPVSDSFTYANIADRRSDLVDFGFTPYIDVIQETLTARVLRRGRRAVLDTRRIRQGRLEDRIPAITAAVQAGLLSTAEGRVELGWTADMDQEPDPPAPVADPAAVTEEENRQ